MAYLHHVVIHFPIALASLAAIFAIYGLVRRSNDWLRVASVVTCLTALFAIITAVSGLVAAPHFVESGGDADAVALHRNVALVATALLVMAGLVSWRASRPGAWPGSRIAAVMSILGAIVSAAGGHFGGEMLHPGIEPWSNKPHTHGPASTSHEGHGPS